MTQELNWWAGASITDWIIAGSAVASACAVVGAYFYARKEISAWRDEARSRQRAEVAVAALTAAHDASDRIRILRPVMDSVPADKFGDRTYIFKRRHERLMERIEIFEALRHAQISAKIVLGDETVNSAFDTIFRVRNDFIFALQWLVDFYGDEQGRGEGEADFFREQNDVVFGRFNENDKVHVALTEALTKLDEILEPIARFEASDRKV